jgi:hypothetical protein
VDPRSRRAVQPRKSWLTLLEPARRLKQVDPKAVQACESYRDAVRLCFSLRAPADLTAQIVAAIAGLYAPHVSDYLNDDDEAKRRDLPANAVNDFEAACGNTAITQWLAYRSGLVLVSSEMKDGSSFDGRNAA